MAIDKKKVLPWHQSLEVLIDDRGEESGVCQEGLLMAARMVEAKMLPSLPHTNKVEDLLRTQLTKMQIGQAHELIFLGCGPYGMLIAEAPSFSHRARAAVISMR